MRYVLAVLLVLPSGLAETEKTTGQVTGEEKVDKRSFDYRFPDGLKQTADSEERLDEWFRDARLGAFIHFGIPSMLAGKYKGKVSGHRYGEWIYFAGRIPTPEYRKLAASFDPDQFDADEWVRVFKYTSNQGSVSCDKFPGYGVDFTLSSELRSTNLL